MIMITLVEGDNNLFSFTMSYDCQVTTNFYI